jgi:uncharacterized membrane protein YeiB
MNQRSIGFDLARAYAILGMYIVNFTFCFGSFRDQSNLGKLSNLFIGNSTSIFIVCAGMGIMFLAKNHSASFHDKNVLKSVILKRSLFLFVIGLLLYNWWPGDILHFYAGYMHIAAFILFVPTRYYLWAAFVSLGVYFLLQGLIPVTTSWDLQTTKYADFWSIKGFIRNTFYNGWNSIFPWFAYFSIGMYLGRQDWKNKRTRRNIFITGLALLTIFKVLRLFIRYDFHNTERNGFYIKYWSQLMEDYFPVNIPFFMITTGWALVIISICMFIGNTFPNSKTVSMLANTGKMTLSHYVIHMTAGVILLGELTDKTYTGFPLMEDFVSTGIILVYALIFFIGSIFFSYLWSKKFKYGPLESVMRYISDNKLHKRQRV